MHSFKFLWKLLSSLTNKLFLMLSIKFLRKLLSLLTNKLLLKYSVKFLWKLLSLLMNKLLVIFSIKFLWKLLSLLMNKLLVIYSVSNSYENCCYYLRINYHEFINMNIQLSIIHIRFFPKFLVLEWIILLFIIINCM